MSFNILAISVGNTRTRLGTFREGKLTAASTAASHAPADWPAALQQAWEPLRDVDGARVVMASVNPAQAERLTQVIQDLLHAEVARVERDLPIPIGRQLDPETIVGDDRLLNAAAAYDVLRQACVVVDAGTAITIDLVDGAGTFHGGAIGPGAQMMLDALHAHTAQLPETTLAPPREPIGHNTIEAMRSAVFYGLRGMVRELVEQYAEVAGAYPMVVATGGNAPMLFENYELVERIVPDLTLMGIGVTMRRALEGSEDEES